MKAVSAADTWSSSVDKEMYEVIVRIRFDWFFTNW